MSYLLGAGSRAKLAGVHPLLVSTVEQAIRISDQDFVVHEGERSLARQRRNVAKGVSWNLDSRHLVQADGFAHAVDLVPWIDGKPVWDWPGCYRIASAVSRAARETGARLIWGGVWDKAMPLYGTTAEAVEAESGAYVARRRALGRRAAIDGPHFELAR